MNLIKERIEKSKYSEIGFFIIGLLLGAALLTGYQALNINETNPEGNLISYLENQSNQTYEVLNREKIGALYEIQVTNEEDQLTTFYVSKDGNRFTQNLQSIELLRERNQALTDFSNCLSGSNTIMFGNSSQQSTQLQIQRLGGSNTVAPIYRDISNETVLQTATQLGIERIPAFYRNETIVQGVQNLETLEGFTGCEYEEPN
jgi:hypothetical protein